MSNKKTILFIENDLDFRLPLEKLLKLEQFDVINAGNLEDAKQNLNKSFDITILNTDLPDGNGIDLLKILKEKFYKPVILLTIKDKLEDKIEGLNNNADYYLTKPIKFDELIAVIWNLLRKYKTKSDYWILDQFSISLITPEYKTIKLTNTEYNIFKIIIKNKGNFISRDEIFKELGKKIKTKLDRSGDMLISRIKKKVGDNNKNQKLFISIRGKGYKFLSKIKLNKDY